MIARALSIRLIVASLVAGLCAGVVVGLIWPAAEMPALWATAAVVYLGAVVNERQMGRCDACGKRVKLGYSTCSRCGYGR